MIVSQLQRDTAVAALNGLEPLDVLAAIGALQLSPRNANALFRLEAAAAVATTITPADGGRDIADAVSVA